MAAGVAAEVAASARCTAPAYRALDVPWIAVELLHGQSLKDVLAQRRDHPRELAMTWLREICLGVAAAHREGVVHCDLKPDNLFVCDPTTPSGPRRIKGVTDGRICACEGMPRWNTYSPRDGGRLGRSQATADTAHLRLGKRAQERSDGAWPRRARSVTPIGRKCYGGRTSARTRATLAHLADVAPKRTRSLRRDVLLRERRMPAPRRTRNRARR